MDSSVSSSDEDAGEEMLRPPTKQTRSNSLFAYRNKQPQSLHSIVMFQSVNINIFLNFYHMRDNQYKMAA